MGVDFAGSATTYRGARGVFSLLVASLLLCGIATRVAPFLDAEQRLLRQFPSEDGYLMLTIARNIGMGQGMSTAAGTIPTNGVQPFVAFVWAIGFWAVDGDRESGVAIALGVQLIVASLTAWAIFLLGRRLLGEGSRAQTIAILAAALWYGAMLTTMHGMNCLETGTYAFVVVLFALFFLGHEGDPLRRWMTLRSIGLGALLGLAFWVRADAVFLIAAACLCRAVLSEGGRWRITGQNLGASFLMGATALLLASPWLFYGRIRFGSFIPISGIAQSWSAPFGQGARRLAGNLAEYILVVAPIPETLETNLATTITSTFVIIAVVAALAVLWTKSKSRGRSLLFLVSAYGMGLCLYYGLFFGAPYFMSRYLFPLSPFLALLWATVVVTVWVSGWSVRRHWVAVVGSVALVAVVAYPNLRLYRKGKHHMHFQVVEWVEENLSNDAWVGAVQSGTLGFFHDRTINLDGKVNPEALAAARAGKIPEYILEKPIRFLADWNGIAAWADGEVLRPHFTLVVDDPARNLAVLQRTDAESLFDG